MTDAVEDRCGEPQFHPRNQRAVDILWKVVATLLVAFIVYVLLHFGSQMIEFQGG